MARPEGYETVGACASALTSVQMVFEKIDPEARNRYDIGELPPDSKIQRQQTWDFHHQSERSVPPCDKG
jgi:hypothetical protein